MGFSSLTQRIRERAKQIITSLHRGILPPPPPLFASPDGYQSALEGIFSLNGQSPLICQPFINYVYLISTDLIFFNSQPLIFTSNIYGIANLYSTSLGYFGPYLGFVLSRSSLDSSRMTLQIILLFHCFPKHLRKWSPIVTYPELHLLWLFPSQWSCVAFVLASLYLV